jgi:hypothetical protein
VNRHQKIRDEFYFAARAKCADVVMGARKSTEAMRR